MRFYEIISLDADGCELYRTDAGRNKVQAVRDAEARLKDKEYLAAGMVRVKVIDDKGVVHEDLRI